MTVKYLVGDVRQVMTEIPDSSVSLIASSPPFIALRSYLPDDHPMKRAEIGSEPDPATFLDTLLALTAEWGRVLAPWGSIAIELGDTFAGSGGAGGDYGEGGLRAEQPAFMGSAARSDSRAGYGGAADRKDNAARPGTRSTGKSEGNGWPRAKSLALIPQLYATSLAYGRNLLTGEPSPAGQWLVRNVIVWHRPNPAVGALGDKVRPSTSYITVATRSPKRWFDLDAVRGGHARDYSREKPGGETEFNRRLGVPMARTIVADPAGAPPLDCWFDQHDTWTLTTQPSSISIKTTERVPCGPDDGGERTTSPDCPVHGDRAAPAPTAPDDEPQVDDQTRRTQHTDVHPDPGRDLAGSRDASTSSRSGQPTATPHSTASSRTVPARSTIQPCTPSAQTADGTSRTPESPELSGADPDMPESSSGEVCPPADEPGTTPHSDDTSGPSSACTCSFHLVKTSVHSHYAMWPAKLAERLILMMCPAEVCAVCGEGRRRVTSTRRFDRYGDAVTGDWNAHNYEPGHGYVGAQGANQSSSGKAVGTTTTTTGWTRCSCDAPFIPGVVLDPFAGSGTTLAVADLHHRDAIGIDLDSRNRDLYPQRRDECARALFDVRPQMTGQLDMFGEPA